MFKTAILFVVLASHQAAAAQFFHYDCKADLSVGLRFNEASRSWEPTTFRADSVYEIRPLTDEELTSPFLNPKTATWGVFKPSDKYPRHTCLETNNKNFRITCGGIGLGFLFDGGSRRYQANYAGGYVSGRDDNEDSPYIEVGRCRFVQP